VYLNLGDEAVTREQFIKTAIRYVGFNTSEKKIKEYTDIYDGANSLFVEKKIEVDKEVSDKSLVGVDFSSEPSGGGIDLDMENNTEVTEEVVTPQKTSRRRTSSRTKSKK
jgi:hypothetical protein